MSSNISHIDLNWLHPLCPLLLLLLCHGCNFSWLTMEIEKWSLTRSFCLLPGTSQRRAKRGLFAAAAIMMNKSPLVDMSVFSPLFSWSHSPSPRQFLSRSLFTLSLSRLHRSLEHHTITRSSNVLSSVYPVSSFFLLSFVFVVVLTGRLSLSSPSFPEVVILVTAPV